MLSRIADSLYWLNRYVERSDTTLRLVYVHYILSLDRSNDVTNSWRPILELCTYASKEQIDYIENDTPAALKKIFLDETNSNSVCNIMGRARENARGAQDHITKEVWEVVNKMYHQANEPGLSVQFDKDGGLKIMEAFSQSTVSFAGITDNTMWRGVGWNFMQLGKFIERGLQTIAITHKELEKFSGGVEQTNDMFQWRYLLLCLSGYEMHLKQYRSQQYTQNVLQQIFLDENFTRSIIYSFTRIHYYLENIMLIHEDQNKELVRSFGRLFSKVKYMDLQAMSSEMLSGFLAEINTELILFSNAVARYYFSYS